jgi:hypothetical protein
VMRTAFASWSMPRHSARRASSSNRTRFPIWAPFPASVP